MNRESMARLRLDRRLLGRRSWITAEELDQELAALPDVSDKMAPRDEAEENEPPASGEPPTSTP